MGARTFTELNTLESGRTRSQGFIENGGSAVLKRIGCSGRRKHPYKIWDADGKPRIKRQTSFVIIEAVL